MNIYTTIDYSFDNYFGRMIIDYNCPYVLYTQIVNPHKIHSNFKKVYRVSVLALLSPWLNWDLAVLLEGLISQNGYEENLIFLWWLKLLSNSPSSQYLFNFVSSSAFPLVKLSHHLPHWVISLNLSTTEITFTLFQMFSFLIFTPHNMPAHTFEHPCFRQFVFLLKYIFWYLPILQL